LRESRRLHRHGLWLAGHGLHPHLDPRDRPRAARLAHPARGDGHADARWRWTVRREEPVPARDGRQGGRPVRAPQPRRPGNLPRRRTVTAARVQDARPLGSEGLVVAPIGLGCMGMSEFYGESDSAEATRTLRRAAELGVTLFDTADVYGRGENERLVGK